MNWCRYHCRRCGSHFTSLEAFDAHHDGSGETLRPCAFPDGVEWIELAGACAIADPSRLPLVAIVYSTERANRAAKYFRGPKGRQTARAERRTPYLEVVAA